MSGYLLSQEKSHSSFKKKSIIKEKNAGTKGYKCQSRIYRKTIFVRHQEHNVIAYPVLVHPRHAREKSNTTYTPVSYHRGKLQRVDQKGVTVGEVAGGGKRTEAF